MKRFTSLLLLAAVLTLPLVPAFGSDPDYVPSLPDTNQIDKDFLSPPERLGAYFVMSAAIQKLSGRTNPKDMPPEVAATFNSYQQEIAKANLTPEKMAQFRIYGVNAEVRRRVLPLYFRPDVLAEFGIVFKRPSYLPPPTRSVQGPQPYTLPQPPRQVPYGRPANQPGFLPLLVMYASQLVSSVFSIILWGLIPLALISRWVYRKVVYSRRYWVPRSNREAIQRFGNDPTVREKTILAAFEMGDYRFRFVGTNLQNNMRFELLRQARSIRRGDLEALRFAHLAYNRGVLDEEKFHAYRVSAIFGDGMTDPSSCEFVGRWARFKAKLHGAHGQVGQARATVAGFAGQNGIQNMESDALARIQKLVMDHPQDPLYREMQRRFFEGVYWLAKGDIAGSAFATPPDARYYIKFGDLDGAGTSLQYSGDGSIITIAPPGSGKTQCNVFPNLLQWQGAAVVLDVKGEIYEKTAYYRSRAIGPVIKFCPLDPANSACYNPLTEIRRETLYLWEDSRFLADMMIVPSGAQDPFFENRARDVLTAIIADMAYWNPPDKRPMQKVMSLINRNGWKEFVERLQENPDVSVMRDEGSSLAAIEPKTLDGILQTAKSSLSAWAGERINMATKRSDWSPLDLRKQQNLTIYLCLKPNEINSYTSLLRVFIAQHIRGLTSELPPHGSPPVLFVLDEFPQLRHMPPITDALEVGRQYGIRLWMFAQYLDQIRKAYGELADGMIGACAVRTFMNPSLQDGTAKAISEQIGLKDGEQHGGKGYGVTEANKYIVDPGQLAGPAFKNLQIVMGVGSKPAKVIKRFAYADPQMQAYMNMSDQNLTSKV